MNCEICNGEKRFREMKKEVHFQLEVDSVEICVVNLWRKDVAWLSSRASRCEKVLSGEGRCLQTDK